MGLMYVGSTLSLTIPKYLKTSQNGWEDLKRNIEVTFIQSYFSCALPHTIICSQLKEIIFYLYHVKYFTKNFSWQFKLVVEFNH